MYLCRLTSDHNHIHMMFGSFDVKGCIISRVKLLGTHHIFIRCEGKAAVDLAYWAYTLLLGAFLTLHFNSH